MNSLPTAKYKQVPNDIEKNTLSLETSTKRFNFCRPEKFARKKIDLRRFDKKIAREKY